MKKIIHSPRQRRGLSISLHETLGFSLRSFFFCLVTSLCFLCFFTRGYSQTQSNDPYTWDFGKVQEGRVFKHTFVLKNESSKTLKIKEVHTSCGCTTSGVKSKVLKPHGSTTLEVKFNSKKYSGLVTQYIYVNTDDVEKPIIKYIIKAEVAKEVTK